MGKIKRYDIDQWCELERFDEGTLVMFKDHESAVIRLKQKRHELQTEVARLKAIISEVQGCFHAAECEGLAAALLNTTDAQLKDLVERRLMFALYAANEL